MDDRFYEALSQGQGQKTVEQKVIKLTEEVGELAAEVLRLAGKKDAKGRSNFDLKTAAIDEACDVILIALSIARDIGASYQDLQVGLQAKLEKFLSQLDATDAKPTVRGATEISPGLWVVNESNSIFQ
jgi:NTP pyrophosphatase (non-canonical NTP hydrolase)